MCEILLVTPPFLAPDAPSTTTAVKKGFLTRRGIVAEQADLSIEVLNDIFSRQFLSNLFETFDVDDESYDDNTLRIYSLRRDYVNTIDTVKAFLRGEDNTLSSLICSADFLPQASRFDDLGNIEEMFGQMGTHDCAEYLSALYLQDISDFIKATVSEDFDVTGYASSEMSAPVEYSILQQRLDEPSNAVEQVVCSRLRELMERHKPLFVDFNIPTSGCLLATLRCGRYIKTNFPNVKVILSGDYPTSRLRQMTDTGIFDCADYIVLDDSELAVEKIVRGGQLIHTITPEGYHDNAEIITIQGRGCPDFAGLPLGKYFSYYAGTDPVGHLLHSGKRTVLALSHGCYWAKCAFCDTALNSICRHETISGEMAVDWMENVVRQTGSQSFDFLDRAISPNVLKDISLELLRRGHRFSWRATVRFERAFTGDLCRLMAAAGCVSVSGCLIPAGTRLSEQMECGTEIAESVLALRNFYYAGIMVHAEIMYGLPTQTLQETVDALEIVRQMCKAQLIGSAMWHRFAITAHSHCAAEPERFGVRLKGTLSNPFANYERAFSDHRGYDIERVGGNLNEALANYLSARAFDRPVEKWFDMKVPPTTVERSFVTDCLILPDDCRIFNGEARLVWLGGDVLPTDNGLLAITKTEGKEVKFGEADADFLMQVIEQCADLENDVRFDDVKEFYAQFGDGAFVKLYHSKQWDILRKMGLLQI